MAFGGSIKAAAAYVELYLRTGQFYKQWAQFQARLKVHSNALQRLASGAVTLGLNTGKFLNGLKAVTSAFTAAVARMRSAGRAIVFGGIVASLPFAAALAELAKFDDKMRTVRAVAEASEKDFIQLSESAKRFATETRFSASEVADLMIELGRAGFVADEIDGMTEAILQLARATGTDTVNASIAAATAIRQFSLPVTDITRVVDGFTVAANASFASVESLTDSFQYAGPVLAQLGYSLEESLAIIGTLANFGIKGSEAGTAVRRITTISAASEEASKVLGVSFVDAAGNARKLFDVLNEVSILTKDLGNAERAAKFNEAFGILGITSATVLTTHGTTVLELLDRLNNGAGTTKRAFEQMDAGIGGSFGRLVSKAKLVAIQIADTLSAGIISSEKLLSDNFARLTKFIDKHKAIIPVIAKVIAGFTGVGVAIFGVGVILSPIAAAMTILGTAFGAIATVVGAATSAIGFFSTALGGAAIPVAVIAIGGLVLAFDKVRAASIQAFREWKSTFSGLGGLASTAVKGITDAIAGGDLDLAWQILIDSAKFAWDAILARMHLQFKEFYYGLLIDLTKLPRGLAITEFATKLLNVPEMEAELDRLRKNVPAEFRTPEESDRIIELNRQIREQEALWTAANGTADQYDRQYAIRKKLLELELQKHGATEAELTIPRRLLEAQTRVGVLGSEANNRQIKALQEALDRALARPLVTGDIPASPQKAAIDANREKAKTKAAAAALTSEIDKIAAEREQSEADLDQRKRMIEIEKKNAEEKSKLLAQQVQIAKDEITAAEAAQAKVKAELEKATAPKESAQRAVTESTAAVASANRKYADAIEAITADQELAAARAAAAAIQQRVNQLGPSPERGRAKRELSVALQRVEEAKIRAAKEELAAMPAAQEASEALLKEQAEAAERLTKAHENLAMIEEQLAADTKRKLDSERPSLDLETPVYGPVDDRPHPPTPLSLEEQFNIQEAEKSRKSFIEKLKAEMAERNAAVRQSIKELNDPNRQRLNPHVPSQEEIHRRADRIAGANREANERMDLHRRIMENQRDERMRYGDMTPAEIRAAKKQAAADARKAQQRMMEQIGLARSMDRRFQNIGLV